MDVPEVMCLDPRCQGQSYGLGTRGILRVPLPLGLINALIQGPCSKGFLLRVDSTVHLPPKSFLFSFLAMLRVEYAIHVSAQLRPRPAGAAAAI
jgi:hypothetical protein